MVKHEINKYYLLKIWYNNTIINDLKLLKHTKEFIVRYLLRYLLFVGVPYIVARKIEKKYLQHLQSKDHLDNKPDSLDVDNLIKDGLDIRGGEFITTGLVAFFMKDLAFRLALTGLIGSTIWSDTADTAIEQVLKYAGPIIAAPGYKFKSVVKRLQKIDNKYTLDIKEILLEKNFSNKEKLELIKLKVQYALKHLRGRKKAIFIMTTLALLTFFLGNGTPAFTYFMAGLREFLGGKDDQDTIKNYLIDIYREYNAPLPEELITEIANKL
jgi:hypothetical protein